MNNKIVLFDSNIKYVGVPLALLSIIKANRKTILNIVSSIVEQMNR